MNAPEDIQNNGDTFNQRENINYSDNPSQMVEYPVEPPSADSTDNKIKKPRKKKVNRLTDQQIRINHVSSEKKRREAIRSIYDELVGLVPDLQPTERRSELIIYIKTTAYLKWLYAKNKRLRKELLDQGKVSNTELLDNGLVWDLENDQELPSPPQE